MSQRRPIPYMDAFGGRLLVQNVTGHSRSLVGASNRDNKIELSPRIYHPANAAKNSIYFSKCSKSVDVNRCEARGLREKVFVVHASPPKNLAREKHATIVSDARYKSDAQPQDFFAHLVACSGTFPVVDIHAQLRRGGTA